MLVGIDEVGRGPLAGPVVVCALAFKNGFPFPVKDSKKLSPKKRQQLLPWIQDNCYKAVGLAKKNEIEELNISRATYLAAQRAIGELIFRFSFLKKAEFIVDGTNFKTDLAIKYTCLEKADERIAEVACASVVAKVVRDFLMKLADFIYPGWDFQRHKGYPTRQHYSLIEKYQLSPFHRRTFCSKIRVND